MFKSKLIQIKTSVNKFLFGNNRTNAFFILCMLVILIVYGSLIGTLVSYNNKADDLHKECATRLDEQERLIKELQEKIK